MIVATVEYEELSLRGRTWLDVLRDVTESVVGQVFANEQSHVEVRLRALTDTDQFETPIFFTIDVAEKELHHDPEELAKQFIVAITEQLDLPPFRVWVRRIEGAFVEHGK